MTRIDGSLRFIGVVRSPLKRRQDAPRQGDEGGALAWLEIDEPFVDAAQGVAAGDEMLVLTWLHQANRDVLRVHPRGDQAQALMGVFATRSPDRPNPVGLHRVRVIDVAAPNRLSVRPLEAIDGTPIIDLKPVLGAIGER
jgi:tRNA-Thr(GGU) m(6)t(6)A37 methyltransferase TsaA